MKRTLLHRKTPLRRRSKSERSVLIRHCDDLFRTVIRHRDLHCQKTGALYCELQVAHFFTRKILRTRWDDNNACLLRKGVHYYWAHSNYEEFRDWWIKRIGQKKFDDLKLRAKFNYTMYTSEIKMIREALKQKVKKLCR